MRTSTTKQVRELLRANPDGLTVKQINVFLGRTACNMRRLLTSMPDAYIDRWEIRRRATPAAVWCVVVPPENCPKPEHD